MRWPAFVDLRLQRRGLTYAWRSNQGCPIVGPAALVLEEACLKGHRNDALLLLWILTRIISFDNGDRQIAVSLTCHHMGADVLSEVSVNPCTR